MPKRNKMRGKKDFKFPTEFVLCCPTTPGHRACMEVCLMYPERLHWEKKQIFFSFASGINSR